MERTTRVESGGSKVEYTYANDQLQQILVDNGILNYTFGYDAFGRKTSVSVGNSTGSRTLASYTYTDRLMTRQTYGNGEYIDFEYDSLDRLIKKTYNKVGE